MDKCEDSQLYHPSIHQSSNPTIPFLVSWTRKHLLDIESLTADEIVTVLDTARAFKAVGERSIKKVPALRGKTVINLFVEPSTRTRISFELAEQRLSEDIINFTAEASSLKKGETLKDPAVKLMMSAESRCSASSKLIRIRVDGST